MQPDLTSLQQSTLPSEGLGSGLKEHSPNNGTLLTGHEYKLQIKNVDMPEEMQERAIELAKQSLTKQMTPREVAGSIKKEFDQLYGPAWHCIVGKSFGSFVTHGVPVETIATFSRMKSITEDVQIIKNALSQESAVIELSEDKALVRRKVPMPESRETLNRTVYVKGFPQESTLDELQEFFAQHSDKVLAIRFRRFPTDRAFKGSVFVEFDSAEEATRFAALNLIYRDVPLVIKTKLAYFTEKNEERNNKKSVAQKTDLLERIGKGRLLKILNFPQTGITHAALKDTLKDSFSVAYVDFNYEPGCAWIRFHQAVAEQFVAHYTQENPLEIGEFKLGQFEVVPEEEQAKYYQVSMNPRKSHDRSGRRNEKKRRAEEPLEAEADLKEAKVDETVEAELIAAAEH